MLCRLPLLVPPVSDASRRFLLLLLLASLAESLDDPLPDFLLETCWRLAR